MKQDVKGIEVTKEWLMIQLQIDTQKVLGRALLAIFKRQTWDEKSMNKTKNNNGVGFSKPDARVGCVAARMYMVYGRLDKWMVDVWMMKAKDGYPRICKYASQLNDIAKERAATKQLEFANRYGRQTCIANDLATLNQARV